VETSKKGSMTVAGDTSCQQLQGDPEAFIHDGKASTSVFGKKDNWELVFVFIHMP
jgi:hypothetical protein